MRSFIPALVVIAALASLSRAHPHHHAGPADDTVPIDSVLWIHMGLQAFTWIILFPLAMVLGLVRHRMHVPLSITSLVLTTGGYFLGHGHKGRSFPHTAHGTLASLMIFYLAAQAGLGIYLKLHLRWSAEKYVRPPLLLIHGILGRLFPVVGWVQCVFGVITLRSWCFGGHLGQCLAHHIMGSAFQAYAVIMLIMMKAGVGWLQRRGHSQEWFDSWVIFIWGWVNALTEHHGGPWTHKDLQHTMLGVLWVFGGGVGIWLSRGGRRSVFPGLMIILTGWAMSGHAQTLMLSTMVHALFGYVLIAAGIARIIEVCFVLQDGPTGFTSSSPIPQSQDRRQAVTRPADEEEAEEQELQAEADQLSNRGASTPLSTPVDQSERDPRTGAMRYERNGWFEVKAFQYMTPYLLTAGGILFMSATDEELKWADSQGVDAGTWGLIDFSISLGLFLWFNVLIDLYVSLGGYRGQSGGVQSNTTPAGQLERGGGRRRGEYVPLSRRSESISMLSSSAESPLLGETERPRPGGSRVGSDKAPPLRGILANSSSRWKTGSQQANEHTTGSTSNGDAPFSEKDGSVDAESGSRRRVGPAHHVLFAESDEEADPFDDDHDEEDH
ncbi:hypothetical protein OC845_004799 [Tilletia horrida]|nr:hypothetical protein OC845_004799 [Tilletia horrida]